MELRAAIVEDDVRYRSQIAGYIRRFGEEHGVTAELTEFEDGESLVEKYRPGFHVLFMDIEMPRLNGMDAARRIRRTDESVTIIFITNMAKYAIHGYEVGALDFLLKPVTYSALEMRLQKVLRAVETKQEKSLLLNLNGQMYKIKVSDILYIEVQGHHVIYHLKDRLLEMRGSMRSAEEELLGEAFFKCNSCYLVNLDYVKAIQDGEALVGPDRLQISRARKKDFMEALAAHIAGI